ncbi:MAG: hypothetical protein H6531_03210 [Actinobacteria bacterium]|nr:hypothetical protein [Actinomycetota bacterium]
MDARLSSDTERWFVRRGIPHFIHAYSATEDVFTRAAPFLVAVLLGETFLVFGDRFSGFGQAAAFAAGLAVILAVAVLVNRLRGRPALSLPDDVGWAEIGAFVLAPVLVRQIAEPGLVALAWGVLLQVAILAVVFVVTSYGIVPMMRWAVAHFLRRLTTLASLMVRVLPLMLVFSLFLFVNAEVWQVADDMRLAYFVIIMSAFAVIGLAFIAWSIDGETGDIARLESWDEAAALAADSPMASACPRGQARPEVPPLSRAERANLLMVLIVSRLAPVIIVTAGVFVLYLGFGLLAIREDVILAWIGADRLPASSVLWEGSFLGGDVVLTRALLYVAGLISVISGLQFAVSLATEPAVRTGFAGEVVHEVREAIAARAAYLTLSGPGADD